VCVCVCLVACSSQRPGGDSATTELHTGVGRTEHDVVWHKCHVRVWGVSSLSGQTLRRCRCELWRVT